MEGRVPFKISRFFCCFLLSVLVSLQGASVSIQAQGTLPADLFGSVDRVKAPAMAPDFGRIPLYFIPNTGQFKEGALFHADTSLYTLWLTREGLIFDRMKRVRIDTDDGRSELEMGPYIDRLAGPSGYEHDISRLVFLGSNQDPRITPVDITGHRVSYFTGDDRAAWKTGIQTSKAVLYRDLYPHIDLKVYGVEKEIEYDFVVKPGGEASHIGFEYRDVLGTVIDKEGDLVVRTAFGELKHSHPVCYQEIQGQRIDVEAEFREVGEDSYGFKVGDYDHDFDLIIDPMVIVYSTYLGGPGVEFQAKIALDTSGAIYLAGWTSSKKFPTMNPLFPELKSDPDVFVTKISPDGRSLVYSTYLGGTRRDIISGLHVDSTGDAYVAGITASADFPTQNSMQELKGVADTFITKIDAGGAFLEYSTLLGGSDNDLARSMDVDPMGNVYVVGFTRSTDFPTKKAFQRKLGGPADCYLAKLNPSGTAVVFATYIGGSDTETPRGVKVDADGDVYICGDTRSNDFPTFKAFQKKMSGPIDVFVMKFNKKGRKLRYSTFLGGSADEKPYSMDVDVVGNVYVTGYTGSADFPLVNPLFDTFAGVSDIFVAKFRPNGRKLHYSTYLGGKENDYGFAIAVAPDNTMYVGGCTESRKFPRKDALFKHYMGEGDVTLTQFAEDGKSLLFSTYLGGSDYDSGASIAIDPLSGVFLTGGTKSTDFPLKNPLQKKKKKYEDLFIMKLTRE